LVYLGREKVEFASKTVEYGSVGPGWNATPTVPPIHILFIDLFKFKLGLGTRFLKQAMLHITNP